MGCCVNRSQLLPLIEERVSRDAIAHLSEAMTVEPLGHRLIVVCEVTPETTAGGLIRADAGQRLSAGWVVSCGEDVGTPSRFPGGWHLPADQLLGRRVIFSQYGGAPLVLGDRDRPYDADYRILNDCDLWAVVNEPTE
jgi:co-chaperonin GroES (HSP10)